MRLDLFYYLVTRRYPPVYAGMPRDDFERVDRAFKAWLKWRRR